MLMLLRVKALAAFARATALPIAFHWSAPLLLLFVLVTSMSGWPAGSWGAFAPFLSSFIAVAIALFFHEWSHAMAALMAGGRVDAVHVHAFGAYVRFSGVPAHRMGAIIAAGPVMNLSVSVLALALWSMTHAALFWTIASWSGFLGALNLLPLPGFDGAQLVTLREKARVARGCAWSMVGLLALSRITLWWSTLMIAVDVDPTTAWFGIAVAIFGFVGALGVGWHGVLGPLREDRNEWGDVVH